MENFNKYYVGPLNLSFSGLDKSYSVTKVEFLLFISGLTPANIVNPLLHECNCYCYGGVYSWRCSVM